MAELYNKHGEGKGMIKVLNIDALVLDEKLQSRTEISEKMVAEYAEDIRSGDEFPPVLTYFDGVNYYLTDGYHRRHAHKRAEKVSISCEVVNGTFRDAVLHATSVNSAHGMRRTIADKRKAVLTLLDDLEWMDWSNAEIARHCVVSAPFVAGLRVEDAPSEIKYKTSGGNVAIKKKPEGRKAKDPATREPAKQEPVEPDPYEMESIDPRDELIERLTKENDDLNVSLALSLSGGTEEEQDEIRNIVEGLREELRVANIELNAIKQSRDQYQSENQQLKAQCASYQRQLKKLQG